MIYKTGTDIPVTAIYGKDSTGVVRKVTTVYNGYGRIIWQDVKSCYGAGYWLNDKPWLNADGWKNE